MVVDEIPDVGIESDYDVIPVNRNKQSFLFTCLIMVIQKLPMTYKCNRQLVGKHILYKTSQRANLLQVHRSCNDFETIEMVIEPPAVVPNSGLQTSANMRVN